MLIERYESLAPQGSMLCFHGTSHVACRSIALKGFDATRRSPALSKIVPYLVGEYVSSDPSVSLKYARQKEVGRDTLSLLVVQVPCNNFEMRNGVWFQHKFGIGSAGKFEDAGVDLSQSTTCVIEDERVVLPRAILTFRPSFKAASAMVCYDVSVQDRAVRRRSEALPRAVLFDLDLTCWPFHLASESHGPPYAPLVNEVGVSDCKGKCLRLCRDAAEIFRILHDAGIPVVLCSNSEGEPSWCTQVLNSCPLDPQNRPELKLGDVVHAASVLRPAANKRRHFTEIQSSLEVPFKQLLYFDDDKRNCSDAKKLGMRCVQVARSGITMERFAAGMQQFLFRGGKF